MRVAGQTLQRIDRHARRFHVDGHHGDPAFVCVDRCAHGRQALSRTKLRQVDPIVFWPADGVESAVDLLGRRSTAAASELRTRFGRTAGTTSLTAQHRLDPAFALTSAPAPARMVRSPSR